MKNVAQIDIDTLNKVMGLLGDMPYSKVFELIAEIQKNTKIVQVEEETAAIEE